MSRRSIFGSCIRISIDPFDDTKNIERRKLYKSWLEENISSGNYYYSKASTFVDRIEFGDEEDLTAFILKFNSGARKDLTRLEKMLIQENAIERMNEKSHH